MALGTAVIVGVGPGLGLALARTFANAGHTIAMLARGKAQLDVYAAELAASGQEARGYVTDASDPDNLRAAIRVRDHRDGRSRRARVQRRGAYPDSPIGGDDQDWVHATAINVLGARVAADAVLPELREGRGTLLFTGGGYALHPSKKFSSLSVGKAGLRAYAQLLHDQLAGTGVHATSITITAGIGS